MIRRAVLATLVSVFAATVAFGLEVESGRMKVEIHEETGRFSLYYLQDTRTRRFIPLFLAQDPRTSVVSLYDEGRVYRLGESPVYSVDAQITDYGAVLRFRTATVTVNQEFRFVASTSAESADGVRIDFVLQNNSDQPRELGLRVLLDTYLGESSNTHFSTVTNQRITRETQLGPESATSYWLSPAQGTQAVGLRYLVDGTGITVPNRVVFANWKRLNETVWEYETNPSRNFNLLPYSINDSAAAVYYGPTVLPRRSSTTMTTVLANASAGAFDLDPASDQGGAPDTQTGATSEQRPLRALLGSVNDLVDEINRRLASDDALSAEEIVALRRLLDEIRERGVPNED